MPTSLLYGPPGAGKSTTLVGLFMRLAQREGPERVGAITFTRAGAEELRSRLARELGIAGTDAQLKRRLPYVGTIHSLCFRLSRVSTGQIVNDKKLRDFCQSEHLDEPRGVGSDYTPDELDDPFLPEPGYSSKTVELMRWALAAARHRMIPYEDAVALIEPRLVARTGMQLHHFADLKDKYEAWKQDSALLDFEDLLEIGCQFTLPVHTLLVDEVQDNSPLLFKVADHWGYAPQVENYALAGDPYQAIYRFAGGDPNLFLNHEGEWHTIGNSWRLSPESAEYAKDTLRWAGWVDPKLDTWTGIGGKARDGDTLYLARTNVLLGEVFISRMIEDGVPFHQLRGRAPLQTYAADAYRFLCRLERGDMGSGMGTLVKQLHRGTIPPGLVSRFKADEGEWDSESVEKVLGKPLAALKAALPNADYFQRVLDQHGVQGLVLRPKHLVSTIHGAKGREADHTVLAVSWGSLPYRNAQEDPQSESLPAYVAVSRHRVSLELVEGGTGQAYPGF